MPLLLCRLVKAVEEIQEQKDDAEQFDAPTNKAMTQIADQTIAGSLLETCAPADTIRVPMIIFST
jgi:hypothetical protein